MSKPITLRVRGEEWTVEQRCASASEVCAIRADSLSALNADGLSVHPDHDPLPLPVILAMAALYTGAA